MWFQDEARFGQQGTLTKVWAPKGSRPTAIKQTEYEWVYLFAAVNPVTGDSSAMLAPTVNTGYMNAHLRFISEQLLKGRIGSTRRRGGHELLMPFTKAFFRNADRLGRGFERVAPVGHQPNRLTLERLGEPPPTRLERSLIRGKGRDSRLRLRHRRTPWPGIFPASSGVRH